MLARLTRLDEATAKLTPPENPQARAHLDVLLAHTPQEPAASPEPRHASPRFASRWVIGLAAAVLVASAWVAGRMSSPKDVVQVLPNQASEEPGTLPQPAPEQPKNQPREQSHPDAQPPTLTPDLPIAPYPAPAPGLMVRVARQTAIAVADHTPAAQLEALDLIAGELRTDAVKRAAAGDLDSLPRLVSLHERVLKLGVASQLARVPEESRPILALRVADGLNQSADEIAAAAGHLVPVAGDLLRPLVVSCREISTAIRDGKAVPAPPESPSPPTPLESLVAQTIRVTDATEPLARADESAHLTAVLTQAITVLSVAGLEDDAARVGAAMDGVLDHGIAANLDRVKAADATGKFGKEVTEVRERTERAMEALEGHLAKASPAARAGLERALEASDPGRTKATGKGSTKPGKKTEPKKPKK